MKLSNTCKQDSTSAYRNCNVLLLVGHCVNTGTTTREFAHLLGKLDLYIDHTSRLVSKDWLNNQRQGRERLKLVL